MTVLDETSQLRESLETMQKNILWMALLPLVLGSSLAFSAPVCPKSGVQFTVVSGLTPPNVDPSQIQNLQKSGVSVSFVEQVPHNSGANICKYFSSVGWKKINPALACPSAIYLSGNNSVFDGKTTGWPTAMSKGANQTHCVLQGHPTAQNPLGIYTVAK